jgi:hypothetical protein
MKRIIGFCAGLALAAGLGRAGDVGDLQFPVDLEGKAQGELIYESLQRPLDVDGHEIDFDADVYLIRARTAVGQYATLDFDLGALDAGKDIGFIGGVGLRYLAYDATTWRAGAFAQARYAPELTMKVGDAEADADMIEGDAGVLFSLKLDTDQLRFRPYAGPMLSILRVSGDTEGGEGIDAEENEIFGGVAGLQLLFPGNNGLRFEGRYVDDFSLSVAASIVF